MRSTRTKSGQRVRFNANGKYWFDGRAAEDAIGFFEHRLKHTKGEWKGRAFIPNREERRIVRKLFGWKRLDGTRKFRRVWIEWARKNGKTEFVAGLMILLLMDDLEGAELYSLAREEGQARIIFEVAILMVAMDEKLKTKIETFKTSLFHSASNGSFKPLSSLPESKQGFNPSGLVGDEVHVWRNGDLVEGVHEGEGARSQPVDVFITTAGELGTYAHEQHEYALSVVKGEIEDDTLLVSILAAPDDADWTDEKTWPLANPNLGVSPKWEFLRDECRKARALPRLQNRFRRYYLNQWVEQSTRWIPMEFWDVCTSAPTTAAAKLFSSGEDLDPLLKARLDKRLPHDPLLWKKLPERLKGRSCCGGLDLATTRDLASLCLWFPPLDGDDIHTLLWRFWLPKDTLKLASPSERSRYESFEASGALTLTPGNVTDYAFIERDIVEWSVMFHVMLLGIDRFNATDLAVRLRGNQDIKAEFFGQGFVSMSAPSKQFERHFLGLQLEHGNNPVARWMARNVAVDTDAHDNIKPIKPSTGIGSKARKTSAKVDGIVAAIMAKGMTMSEKALPATESVYEKLARLKREKVQAA